MSLTSVYPDDFLKLWEAYPKHPVGRSKKRPSYNAFAAAKKRLSFTPDELEQIRLNIEDRKKHCETWQSGNKYGPPMMATYFNQELWNEPFKPIRSHMARSEEVYVPSWKAQGFASPEAYEAHREANREKVSAMLRGALH